MNVQGQVRVSVKHEGVMSGEEQMSRMRQVGLYNAYNSLHHHSSIITADIADYCAQLRYIDGRHGIATFQPGQ